MVMLRRLWVGDLELGRRPLDRGLGIRRGIRQQLGVAAS
jgi:hypothetical protein